LIALFLNHLVCNLLKLILVLNLINVDRSENADYKGSGYDRGHLAAAGNHKVEQKHMEQTFFLSNMAPQIGIGFNRDSWNRLEKHVRKLTNVYKDVYVCTGPLYLPKYVYLFTISICVLYVVYPLLRMFCNRFIFKNCFFFN